MDTYRHTGKVIKTKRQKLIIITIIVYYNWYTDEQEIHSTESSTITWRCTNRTCPAKVNACEQILVWRMRKLTNIVDMSNLL